YGVTKLGGERAVMKHLDKYFIVRTSWVFGINGNNFVKTMLRLGNEKDELNVVCDQIGSPTYTPDLARLICDLIVTDKYGIYHGTNENYCSWAEFASEIMKLGGRKAKINPVPSSEYPVRAERPHNSRLSKKCLDDAGIKRLPTWQDALKRYLKELGE
ncbi:MAG TPA: dTDP-4-dehydrorhamnose reductase, partial [Ruminococcaceae bacterium]|nr:dTDP-4-dehydrorhamnose reductase [Oscillospiraceae bacterium]